MKKLALTLVAILMLTFGVAAAQEKTEAAAPAKKAAKAAPAKKVAKGETLTSLVKTFKSVHADVVFAEKFVNTKAEGFDKAMAKALANDLMKWKKLRIEVKKLKKAKDAKAEVRETKLKELEENILAKYTESAEAAPAEKKEEAASEENAGDDPKTEKGKEILEKLKNKKKASKEEASEEKSAEEKKEAKSEEKPAVKVPSNVRVEPSRALYNRIEPGAEASTKITLKNRAKAVFEGTIVPIENWITVNPTTVTIEPGSSIDVDVTIKAQDTSKSRLEGTIELRTEGESSRRIPAVVRTK